MARLKQFIFKSESDRYFEKLQELGKKFQFIKEITPVRILIDEVRGIERVTGYEVTLRDFSSPSDLVSVQTELSLILRPVVETKSINPDEPSLYPFTDNKIWSDVQKERIRQIHLHGVQDHPCVTQSGPQTLSPNWLCKSYGVPTEEEAKKLCEAVFSDGTPTYAHIAVEELSEAISEPDPVKRYQEVIQLATVALAWAEKIKRIDLKESEKK